MPALPAPRPDAREPAGGGSAAVETTGVESEAEPTGPEPDATAEPRGQGNVQDLPLPAPVVLVEETVPHIDMEEPWSAAAAPATVVEETVQATVAEGPAAAVGGHEQSP